MALPQPKQFCGYLNKPLATLLAIVLLQACTSGKKVYESDCDAGINFKPVEFSRLIDSLASYDKKYVEVSGKYEEDKGQSALFSDSLLVDHSTKNALWVDFSQDCPLYLAGTRAGLFEYNDGQFTRMDDKAITLRGRINLHNRGHLKQYKGAIERISLVKL